MWSCQACAALSKNEFVKNAGSSVAGLLSNSAILSDALVELLDGCVGSTDGVYVMNAVGGSNEHSSSLDSSESSRKFS